MQNTKLSFKKIILFIIVLLFLTIPMVVRAGIIHKVNCQFQKTLNYDSDLAYAKYYLEEDGYIYRYRAATFFNNDAFASVISSDSQKLYLNETGEITSDGMQITLYIWPLKDTIGLDFYEKTLDDETSLQVYINLEKECVGNNLSISESNYVAEIIKEYEEEIDKLIERADKKWDIKK